MSIMNTIDTIIARFESEGKHVLARALDRTKKLTIKEYSQSLFLYQPSSEEIEPELTEAFLYEFRKQGLTEIQAQECLGQLISQRSLQCAHHVGVVQSSRMLCIDWLTSLGLTENEWYMVGAFSGVPFSNSSRPGRLSFGGKEMNLVPKTYQDALVFAAKIPNKTLEQWRNIPDSLRQALPSPVLDGSFSHWALSILAGITKKVLQKDKVLYFDVNHVVTRYIISILKKNDRQHPIYKILLEPKTQDSILKKLGTQLHFFYSTYDKGKYQKQESLYVDGMGFRGEYNYHACDRDQLISALESGNLCPATFLTFTALSCLNQFQCFGSFSQVEYLTKFRECWSSLPFLNKYEPLLVPVDTLTTAMFPSDPLVSPIDVFLGEKELPGNENDILGEYYKTIWRD